MKTRDAVRLAISIMENELNRMVVKTWTATDEETDRYAKIADAIKTLQSLPEAML